MRSGDASARSPCRPRALAILALIATYATAAPSSVATAPDRVVPVERLLDSIGVVTTFPDRGQPIAETIRMIRYCGFHWVRGGIEGLTEDGPTTVRTFLDLHRRTGARISWGLVSGGTDVARLVSTGRILAGAGALLAFEGVNEPNNWGVVVDGVAGGGRDKSWKPVAELQSRLYAAVKADPVLRRYPVWSISEPGAEVDDVGLQFLRIPAGRGVVMPDGTRYADAANLHNYPARSSQTPLPDNLTWNAADPTPAALVDGVHGNHGVTWNRRYAGYAPSELEGLPRVTTETGTTLQGSVNEETQGRLLLNVYLSQFARGFSHTSVYLLRDRTDEPGNQTFGFFRPDYAPRRSAVLLHNLTTILSEAGRGRSVPAVGHSLDPRPGTVHDLMLRGRDGGLMLVVWGERVSGDDLVTLTLERPMEAVIHDPTVGTDPVASISATATIDLRIGDHPLVVRLSDPKAGGY